MRALFAVLALVAASAAIAQELPPAATETVDFAKQIQPIFEQRCVGCHGPNQQFNGLRLDRKADALKGGASGPVILPGDSANSRLIHLVAGYQVKVVMPPTGDPLTAQQVGLLRAWIDQGANWPDDAAAAAAENKPLHWAYAPRSQAAPPQVRERPQPDRPIHPGAPAKRAN